MVQNKYKQSPVQPCMKYLRRGRVNNYAALVVEAEGKEAVVRRSARLRFVRKDACMEIGRGEGDGRGAHERKFLFVTFSKSILQHCTDESRNKGPTYSCLLLLLVLFPLCASHIPHLVSSLPLPLI